MSTNVLLTGNHLIAGTNRIRYNFPNPISLVGQEVSLTNCSLYNSFANCSAALGTNTFQFKIPTSWNVAQSVPTYTTYSCTIADGFYDYTSLNAYLQAKCVSLGLYLRNTVTGQNVYFLSIVANVPLYSVQLNVYSIPNQAAATANSWILPSGSPITLATGTVSASAQFIIPSGFGRIIGFDAGNYPSSPTVLTGQTSSNYSSSPIASLSTKCPQINAVSSIIVRCNLVMSSGFSVPNDLLCQINLTSAYGAINNFFNSGDSTYSTVVNNTAFSYIQLDFFQQDLVPLVIRDSQLAITLNFRSARK